MFFWMKRRSTTYSVLRVKIDGMHEPIVLRMADRAAHEKVVKLLQDGVAGGYAWITAGAVTFAAKRVLCWTEDIMRAAALDRRAGEGG